MDVDERVLLARGVALFNDGEYFACHEVLEELWIRSVGEKRAVLQGLIQAAVAILHAERGNHRGAMSVYRKAMRNLGQASDECMGLRLGGFRSALKELFTKIEETASLGVRPRINVCVGGEAEVRASDLAAGRVKGVPAEKAFKKAQSALK